MHDPNYFLAQKAFQRAFKFQTRIAAESAVMALKFIAKTKANLKNSKTYN